MLTHGADHMTAVHLNELIMITSRHELITCREHAHPLVYTKSSCSFSGKLYTLKLKANSCWYKPNRLRLVFFQGLQGQVWGQETVVRTPVDRWHGGAGLEVRGRLCLGLQKLWRWCSVRLCCSRYSTKIIEFSPPVVTFLQTFLLSNDIFRISKRQLCCKYEPRTVPLCW